MNCSARRPCFIDYLFLTFDGIIKDVRFYPMLNFVLFLFLDVFGPPSPLTFHDVNNDGQSIFSGVEGDHPKRTRGNKTIQSVFLSKRRRRRRRFHKNTAHARLGCLGCLVTFVKFHAEISPIFPIPHPLLLLLQEFS